MSAPPTIPETIVRFITGFMIGNCIYVRHGSQPPPFLYATKKRDEDPELSTEDPGPLHLDEAKQGTIRTTYALETITLGDASPSLQVYIQDHCRRVELLELIIRSVAYWPDYKRLSWMEEQLQPTQAVGGPFDGASGRSIGVFCSGNSSLRETIDRLSMLKNPFLILDTAPLSDAPDEA